MMQLYLSKKAKALVLTVGVSLGAIGCTHERDGGPEAAPAATSEASPTDISEVSHGATSANGGTAEDLSTSADSSSPDIEKQDPAPPAEATTTTISPERILENQLNDLKTKLTTQEDRYYNEQSPKIAYSKSESERDLDTLKGVSDEVQQISDSSESYRQRKADVNARLLKLMEPGMRAIGNPYNEGYPNSEGLLNTVPAQFPADIQAVRDALAGEDSQTALARYSALELKLNDLQTVLREPGSVEAMPPETTAPAEENVTKPVDQMTAVELQRYSHVLVAQYKADVEAYKKKQKQQQTNGNGGNGGNSNQQQPGSSGGSGSGSGSGSGPTPKPQPATTVAQGCLGRDPETGACSA